MLLNLLGFAAIVILSINALSIDSSVHARHQVIARQYSEHLEPVALKKRDTTRCKPRPVSSSSVPQASKSSPPPPATKAPAAPAPSLTPTPTPTPSPSPQPSTGGKAGLAWSNGNDPAFKNFLGSRVSFFYTWSPEKPDNIFGLKFAAMLWGMDQISDFQRLVVPGYTNIVLGFNEPDLSTQSNIDPWTGASLWKQFIAPLQKDGYALITPAVTSGSSGKPWMQNFFGACGGCHFDGLALHWYGTDAQAFITYVTDFHTTFGLDIWVTEFACLDFAGGPQADQGQIFAFMNTVTGWMDNTPWVAHYSAFGFSTDLGGVNPLIGLINSAGFPTALGSAYIQ